MRKERRTHKVRWLSTVFGLGLSLVAWLGGSVLSLHAATGQGIGLGVHIKMPPNAITDLTAAPVGVQNGDVQLAWTAPGNNNGINMDYYLIRYATFPAPSVAQAETWWANAAASQVQRGPAFLPGTQEFTTIQGLTVGITYYFGIKAVDKDAMISPLDTRAGTAQQAATKPLDSATKPNTPNNFAGTALSTGSIQWTWDSVSGAGFYVVNEFPGGGLIGQTTTTSLKETDLSVNTPYSRTLSAGNGAGVSQPTVVQTVYTQAAIPTTLTVTNVTFTSISLSWNANGNPAGTQYRLERSVDDVNYVVAGLTTTVTFSDTGLNEETTYYYRVRALNGDGITTSTSNTVNAYTPKKIDFISPRAPLGLKASVDSSHRAFTLTWEAVTENTDGTVASDLVGYHIYRRNTLRGTPARITTTPLTVTAYADQVDGQTFFYTVRAIDDSDNESGETFSADSSQNANIIFLAPDDKSTVFMPSEVNDILRTGFNNHNEAIRMEFEETPVPSQSEIIRNIRFKLMIGHSSTTISDVSFDRPIATVAIGYSAVNGQVAIGSPKAQNVNAGAVTNATPDQLSLYWYNGVTYVKVGGVLDTIEEVLRTNSSFIGQFQLRVAANATSLTLNKANVFPRTFTPNGDGFNDRVYFVIENPNSSEVTGEITDMKGRHIATLPPPSTNSGIGTTLIWDGKDMAGMTVPSGVYLYRIKGEGKTFTGTVVVAR